MRKIFCIGTLAASLCLALLAFPTGVVNAGEPKNLKVYPKGTSKNVIKKDMKRIAKALGVKCEHCHNKDAMEEDTKMKIKARKMMLMTADFNKSLKKGGFKESITCNTCHQGAKEPKH